MIKMSEELTDKIKDFFSLIECRPLVILETPRAGEEVDNRCGVEFDLPRYAVIYLGKMPLKKLKRFYEFQKNEKKLFMHLTKWDAQAWKILLMN